MPFKAIVKLGNKQLAIPSVPIKNPAELNQEIEKLIIDMKDTMNDKGGVGIAAPQIGCNKRVIMFGFEKNSRYPNAESIPFTVLINPIIKLLSEEMVDGWESNINE